jgi:cyclic-di-GMP phosphodiesterase TipF (flagellum assembly factor)
MRRLTTAFLIGGYLFVALTVGAFLWRGGAGWGAGAAAVLGTLGFVLCVHLWITQSLSARAIREEIEQIRDAHRSLADALEQTQGAFDQLADLVEAGQPAPPTLEARVVEDLVARIERDLEAKLLTAQAADAPVPEQAQGRRSNALLAVVREALEDGRVDLYLQPVVSLPQRKTVMYEAFSRLRDETGRVIMPAEYLAVAEPEGLLPAIDNLLLFRCVQIVRRLAKQDRRVGVFCNVSAASLSDEVFFPQFAEFLSDNRDLAGALVFELGQAAFEARGSLETRNMARLADLGFRFSVDRVSSLDLDFADLKRSDVKYLKVGATLLVDQLLSPESEGAPKQLKDIHAADFAALGRRFGLEIVAEKVEQERQVPDVLDLDVAFGQGHLFGEPRAVKGEILAETAPPAEFLRETLRRVA